MTRYSGRVSVGLTASKRGQNNPNAKYTDHEVEMVRELHEVVGFGYRRIAEKMEMPRATVQCICTYRRR